MERTTVRTTGFEPAIPTSARARAGASFTPSPTITATTSPRSWSSATACSLSAGEHLGDDLVDAHGHGHTLLATRSRIPGDQHHADECCERMELVDCLLCLRTDLVPRARMRHRVMSSSPRRRESSHLVRTTRTRRQRRTPAPRGFVPRVEQRRAADAVPDARRSRLDPATGERRGSPEPERAGRPIGARRRLAQRMLAVGFDRGRDREHVVVGRPRRRWRLGRPRGRPGSGCRSCRTAPRRRCASVRARGGP